MKRMEASLKITAAIPLVLLSVLAGCGKDESEPLITNGSGFQVTSDGGGEPAWSPDGTMLAYTNRQDLWTVQPKQNAQSTRLTEMDGVESSPVWLPGGQGKIAFLHESPGTGAYSISSVVSGSAPQTILAMEHPVADLGVSADGTLLAFRYLNQSPGVYLLDLTAESKAPQAVPRAGAWGDVLSPFFGPVSGDIYYIEQTDVADNVYTIPPGGGETVRITAFSEVTEKLEGLSVSPNELSLALTLGPGPAGRIPNPAVSGFALYTLRLESGLEPTRHTKDIAGDALSPAWAPGGGRLAVSLQGQIWIIEPR